MVSASSSKSRASAIHEKKQSAVDTFCQKDKLRVRCLT
jgi:hypothetical protein